MEGEGAGEGKERAKEKNISPRINEAANKERLKKTS